MGKILDAATKYGHLFRSRPETSPPDPEEASRETQQEAALAEGVLEFSASRYHARLVTKLDEMVSAAFRDMKGGGDTAAGRAAGIHEVKEFIRLDIERARKVTNA